MTKATFKNVNKALAARGVVLVKGRNYFWFAVADGAPANTATPQSVYTPRLADLTLQEWVEHATT